MAFNLFQFTEMLSGSVSYESIKGALQSPNSNTPKMADNAPKMAEKVLWKISEQPTLTYFWKTIGDWRLQLFTWSDQFRDMAEPFYCIFSFCSIELTFWFDVLWTPFYRFRSLKKFINTNIWPTKSLKTFSSIRKFCSQIKKNIIDNIRSPCLFGCSESRQSLMTAQ